MCGYRAEGLRVMRLCFHADLYNQRVQLEPMCEVHSPSQTLSYLRSLAELKLLSTPINHA